MIAKLFSIALLSSLVFSSTSFSATPAKANFSLSCVSTMPTTSFYLRTEGNEAILKMVHHNGTRYMPIHEGIVVPQDFGLLKDKASVLTPMGDIVEFRFPLKKCETYGAGLMSCSGGNRQTFNGVEIDALMFYTSKTREETLGITVDRWKTTVSLHALYHGPVMELAMNYDLNECQFSF